MEHLSFLIMKLRGLGVTNLHSQPSPSRRSLYECLWVDLGQTVSFRLGLFASGARMIAYLSPANVLMGYGMFTCYQQVFDTFTCLKIFTNSTLYRIPLGELFACYTLEIELSSTILVYGNDDIQNLDFAVTTEWHLVQLYEKDLPVFYALNHQATEDVVDGWEESPALPQSDS
ncbi:hypothetical protein C8J56DRAFT_1060006 [Mycena floridula]|nr:hypothetical protein C8J56DRAFT_1060006 [Mycena floridula]